MLRQVCRLEKSLWTMKRVYGSYESLRTINEESVDYKSLQTIKDQSMDFKRPDPKQATNTVMLYASQSCVARLSKA